MLYYWKRENKYLTEIFQIQAQLAEFGSMLKAFDNLGLETEKYPQLKTATDGMDRAKLNSFVLTIF